MTIDEIIKGIEGLGSFDVRKDGVIEPVISTTVKEELIEELKKVTLPEDFRLEYKDKYITLLKARVEYLEDFIVRLARDSTDI